MSSTVPPIHAVITGDIVGSGHLSAVAFERVQEGLRRGGAELRTRFPDALPLPVELFRGDSWQMLVTDPARAFRMALFLRAYLRAEAGADTRFAIGVGPVEQMPTERVATGRGEAFRLSGQLLDAKVATHMRVAIAGDDSDTQRDTRAIATVMQVLDVVAKNWTRAQARAVCGALNDQTQETIAAAWPDDPITQQAVAQHLARAGWDGIREAVVLYEEIIQRRQTC
jgi:hypothetical protein